MIDSWGLYNRECVSYAAWKVWVLVAAPHFRGMGHAYQWVATTSRHGIPNGRTPARFVLLGKAGTYGHVMYVEAKWRWHNGLVTNRNRDGAYHYYKTLNSWIDVYLFLKYNFQNERKDVLVFLKRLSLLMI